MRLFNYILANVFERHCLIKLQKCSYWSLFHNVMKMLSCNATNFTFCFYFSEPSWSFPGSTSASSSARSATGKQIPVARSGSVDSDLGAQSRYSGKSSTDSAPSRKLNTARGILGLTSSTKCWTPLKLPFRRCADFHLEDLIAASGSILQTRTKKRGVTATRDEGVALRGGTRPSMGTLTTTQVGREEWRSL